MPSRRLSVNSAAFAVLGPLPIRVLGVDATVAGVMLSSLSSSFAVADCRERELRVAVCRGNARVAEPQRNSLGIPTLAAMLMCVDMSFVHEREQKVNRGDEGGS